MRRFIGFLYLLAPIYCQEAPAPAPPPPRAVTAPAPSEGRWDEVLKAVDDLMWQTKLGDIADVDKVEYTSLPPHRAPNPNAPGATNPVIVHAYTFIPKKLDRARKQPLIVLIHGGVPVSDLVARMGYESESHRQQYSAPYHIGKTVREDIQEYLRRSPYFHAGELQTPLLIPADIASIAPTASSESRREVYLFPASYLHPANPAK